MSATVGDLFDAEYKLRQSARNYADGAIARNAKELRAAAVAYAKLAEAFESALDARPATADAAEPCGHLAAADEPGANLMPYVCPNCGRYYVNDDNSVERPRAKEQP